MYLYVYFVLRTFDQLDDVLQTLEHVQPHTIKFDIYVVTFMNSNALNHLARLYKHQRELDGHLAIRAPSRQALRVLEISGLTKLLTIA